MVDGFIAVEVCLGGLLELFFSGLCAARLVALEYGGNFFISLQNIPLRFLLLPFAERSNWKGRRNPASRFREEFITSTIVMSSSDSAKLCRWCCALDQFLESQTERQNEAFEEKHLLCVNYPEIAVAIEAKLKMQTWRTTPNGVNIIYDDFAPSSDG